jgi:hypothetical protein
MITDASRGGVDDLGNWAFHELDGRCQGGLSKDGVRSTR